jgi:hypothetical protein
LYRLIFIKILQMLRHFENYDQFGVSVKDSQNTLHQGGHSTLWKPLG